MSQQPEVSMPEQRSEGTSRKARKWWRDSRYLAAIGAALAGVASFNPALNNWLTYSLESTKQEGSRRDAYLDRAIDPQRNIAYRLSVLQYLVSTLPERDTMRKWAKDQLDALQKFLEAETQRIELERKTDKITSEITTRQKALSKTKPASPERRRAEEEIEKLKVEVGDLKSQLDKAVKASADLRPAPLIVNPSTSHGVDSDPKTGIPTQKKDELKSPENPAGKSTHDHSGFTIREPGTCCITCFGLELCGHEVVTACGSCSGANSGGFDGAN